MTKFLNIIFDRKIPPEVIYLIENKYLKQEVKKKDEFCCYNCQEPVSYYDYIDGAGYFCYSCSS